jgi:hypothetical protein
MQAQNLRLEPGWEKSEEEEGGREGEDGEGEGEEGKGGCSIRET